MGKLKERKACRSESRMKKLAWSGFVGAIVVGGLCVVTQKEGHVAAQDTMSDHIQLNMFNYSVGDDENAVYPDYGGYHKGINAGHEFKFLTDAGSLPQGHMNKWTGYDGSPLQGIVEDELVNGFPKLSKAHGGESLAYLFDESAQNGKDIYTECSGLLNKGENNLYYFDSHSQYAELDTRTKKFTLKDVVKNNNGQPFRVFYPFDSHDSVQSKVINNEGVGSFASGDGLVANYADHYFGMHMSFQFLNPKNGQIKGDDMVFSFSGDDDVWVFVDGKIALDLGGIHNANDGEINFHTGDVYHWTGNGERHFQRNIYGSSTGVDNADFSVHKVDMFYLERGNSASNCSMRFNLPTIAKDSIVVAKNVEADAGVTSVDDVDFRYVLTVDEKVSGQRAYRHHDVNGQETTRMTDEKGRFSLKKDEYAIFDKMNVGSTFEVKEEGAYLDGYQVAINGQSVEVTDMEDQVLGTRKSASSGKLTVGTHSQTIFKNILTKTGTLSIQQKVTKESINLLNKDFLIHVKVNGKPYQGNYKLNGKVNKTDNGEMIISNEDVITIDQLAYGTSFEVIEPTDTSFIPSYDLRDCYDINEEMTSGYINGDAKMVITAQEVSDADKEFDLIIDKEWIGDKVSGRPGTIAVDIIKNDEVLLDDVVVRPDEKGNWHYVVQGLSLFDKHINGNYVVNHYGVVESMIGNEVVSNGKAAGYLSVVEEVAEHQFRIQNIYSGKLVIEKTIDEAIYEMGDPIFTFQVTDAKNQVNYYSIRFQKGDGLTKSITIDDVPLGKCSVRELETYRYGCDVDNQQVEIVYPKSVVKFNNRLNQYNGWTHTDRVVNSLKLNEKIKSYH